jgi:nucleoid DNA-binding protein
MHQGSVRSKGSGWNAEVRGLTQSKLIAILMEKESLTNKGAEAVVKLLFTKVKRALQKGDGIEIRGFGVFTMQNYAPYKARNPKSGNLLTAPQDRSLTSVPPSITGYTLSHSS